MTPQQKLHELLQRATELGETFPSPDSIDIDSPVDIARVQTLLTEFYKIQAEIEALLARGLLH